MTKTNAKIIIVSGDPFFRKRDIAAILSHNDDTSSILVEVESPDASGLYIELYTPPLFSERKVVLIKEISTDADDVLVKFSNSPGDFCTVVIDENDIKKSKRLVKKLNRETVELIVFPRCYKEYEAKKFTLDRGADFGMSFDNSACSAMTTLCGCDYSSLNSEIEKLGILYGSGRVEAWQVLEAVEPNVGEPEFLKFYLSIMEGDVSNALLYAQSISDKLAADALFSCLMKLCEASLILSHCRGDAKKAHSFATRKRAKIDSGIRSRIISSEPSTSKASPPSAFLYKVAGRILARIKSIGNILYLYEMAYDYFVDHRLNQNENLTKAHVYRLICLMCRS